MRHVRWWRRAGRSGIGVAWIAVWLVNLASMGSYDFGNHGALSAALRITVNGRIYIATCPHHPDGCPKDCMCPKTYVEVGRAYDAQDRPTLEQPYLATCTSHRAFAQEMISSPLPEPNFLWRPIASTEPLSFRIDAATQTGYPRPTLKIPIV